MRNRWGPTNHRCSGDDERFQRGRDESISESVERIVRGKLRGSGKTADLVRNILEHTFELVEDVIADSERLARDAFGRATREPEGPAREAGEPSAESVLAWQEAVLNKNAVCSICNEILPKGTRAAFGVIEGSTARPVACAKCAHGPEKEEQPAE